MEPESSLPCTQQPATGQYPEPDESNLHPRYHLPNIHFNIILPSMPTSSEWSRPFKLSNQNFARISHLPMRATFPTNLILITAAPVCV
jgi:hypothetical protein